MNIQYIKSNISNTSQDSLVKLLYELVLQDIDSVEDYITGVSYKKGDRVYLQENGNHKIYQCIVNVSSNTFIRNEWQYIMEIYNGVIDKVYNLKLQEEVHIIKDSTKNGITTNLNFDETKSTIAIYNGKKRYCNEYDFTISNKQITFKNPFNVGDRLILEVRENLGIQATLGVIFYDLYGIPYNVIINNVGEITIQKSNSTNPTDIKYTELVTGEYTYTMMIDSSMNPPILGLYRDIETYITGSDGAIYKLEVSNETLNMIKQDKHDVYSDTKIIMGSDKKFYTLAVVNSEVVATVVNDESLKSSNFDLGIKVITKEFKNRLIDINNGVVTVKPYINNGGFHNILFKSISNSAIVRLSITEDLSLELNDGYDHTIGRTSSQVLDYFYFFDDDWNYYKMYIDNGELLYEPTTISVIPDSKGINMLSPSGEIIKISLSTAINELCINRVVNLSKSGSFESPIEGFVIMDNNKKKIVTVNAEINGFDVKDTNEIFRTNHHYIMSEDNKIYKLNVKDNLVSFIEQTGDDFIIEFANNGKFIKSNEMITKFDIKNGDVVFKPISTFVHRIKSDNGRSYILDVDGEMYKEKIILKEMTSDSFNSTVGTGYLYLKDVNGAHYKINVDSVGNLKFTEVDKINNVDYGITSLIHSTLGWYEITLNNKQITLTKIFDNIYENLLSYGNIVKKDFILTSDNRTDYSLFANGNGEVNIKELQPVDVKGLIIKSDNGYTYGLGVDNNKLISYKSFVSNPRIPTSLYITDIITGQKYRLYMSNESLCSELVVNNSLSNLNYLVYDVYQKEYILEMKNGVLTIRINVGEDDMILLNNLFKTAKIEADENNIKVSMGGVENIPYKEENIDIATMDDIDDILVNILGSSSNKKGE